ncbi:MAG: hypothetical protein H7832_10515 [Magnetococcus sp. DMHC-6]
MSERAFNQEGDGKSVQLSAQELIQQLEHANRELKEFAYVISHDLKAPLRGISSLAQWIMEDYAECLDVDGREQCCNIPASDGCARRSCQLI